MDTQTLQIQKSVSLRRFSYTSFLSLLWVVLVSGILTLSCGNLQELIGLKEKEEPIPKEVSETAKGLMELFQEVFEAPDPANADKPGMNVYWDQQNVKLVLQFQSYVADPTAPSIAITGTYSITITNINPYTISISGSVSVTNYTYKTVGMEGTFRFPGTSPQSGEPSVSGTFKVDSKSYDLSKVYASIDWDDGNGGGTPSPTNPAPPTSPSYPSTFTPAPADVRGKVFYLCGSRPYSSTTYNTVLHVGDRVQFNSTGQECTIFLGNPAGIKTYIHCQENFNGTESVTSCELYDTTALFSLVHFFMKYSGLDIYALGQLYGEPEMTYYYFHVIPTYSGPFPTDNFYP
ncbi:MAG: hypothetical protein N2442_14860 [Spirochaetes bacterium]|nr:hypothetical protein [Spirochaetota bacterium]